jgi:hypothetical protein
MTMEDLRELDAAVKHVEHLGKFKNRLIRAKDKREFNVIRDEAVASMLDNNAIREESWEFGRLIDPKVEQGISKGWHGLLKTDTLMEMLDGFRDGPLHRIFIRPMAEATDVETRMQRDMGGKLAKLFDLYTRAQRASWNTPLDIVTVKGVGKFHVPELWIIALNAGNVEGREALIEGRNWTEEQVDQVLQEGLTEKDWKFVSGVWEMFEGMRPELFAFDKEMTGYTPKPVEAVPIQTRFGLMKGGYFPIKYDPRKSWMALRLEQDWQHRPFHHDQPEPFQGADVAPQGVRRGRADQDPPGGHQRPSQSGYP